MENFRLLSLIPLPAEALGRGWFSLMCVFFLYFYWHFEPRGMNVRTLRHAARFPLHSFILYAIAVFIKVGAEPFSRNISFTFLYFCIPTSPTPLML